MSRNLVTLALVLALGAVMAAGLVAGGRGAEPGGSTAAGDQASLRQYFAENGVRETGSINLVSSIYLGYRAFDTLAETVILFLAVTGVLVLRGEGK